MTHRPMVAAFEHASHRTFGVLVFGDMLGGTSVKIIFEPGSIKSSEIYRGTSEYLREGEGHMEIYFDLEKAHFDYGKGEVVCLNGFSSSDPSLAQEIVNMLVSESNARTT